MNSKNYDSGQLKFKMNSHHLLNSVTDIIFHNGMEEHKNVGNNNYENYFKDINQSSNHDDQSAMHEIAKIANNSTSNSADNFHLTPFDRNYVKCSKSVQYNLANKQPEMRREESSSPRDNHYSKINTSAKTSADKKTYCRPLYNFYNQEFVYRTMSRNARLQQLLSKIIYTRKREKQQERWNNFINELKTKHECPVNEHRNIKTPIPQDIVSPEMIDDYYNTRFHWRQSNQCQNLLDDFYGTYNSMHPNVFYKPCNYNDLSQISSYRPCVYENHPYCYPTSSEGRFQMCNREMDIKNFNDNRRSRPPTRHFRGNTIIVDRDCSTRSSGRQHFRQSHPMKYPLVPVNQGATLKSSAIQTELNTVVSGESAIVDIKEESIKQKYERVSKNVDRLKKKIDKSQKNGESKSLSNIENKLNDMIQSINACLLEIKTNNEFKRKIVCGMVHNVSRSTLTFENIAPSRETLNKMCISQFDDILYEELDKSNKVKRDIDDIINRKPGRHCGVQITIDIPTRERATEVTASLSKTRLNVDKMVVVEEINNTEAERMTIAVNTDPLGLLGLLKISTETVKRILSYMPQINYYSYLPMIQFPQCSREGGVSHYVCSICGAAFGRPSQLSDHIQDHNLSKSRDCCVCRHMLDLPRQRLELFSCRYCGQRFTRAYCSQLHEESCAKRLGERHDVTSSLTLLR